MKKQKKTNTCTGTGQVLNIEVDNGEQKNKRQTRQDEYRSSPFFEVG